MVPTRGLSRGKTRAGNGPFIPNSGHTHLESACAVSETGLNAGGQR